MSEVKSHPPSWREQFAALTSRGQKFVRVDEAADVMNVSRIVAAKRLASWADRGWLRRAKRGIYVPVPASASNPKSWTEDPLVVADEIYRPCYVSGWTAANHWSLTEQIFRPTIIMTTQRVRETRQTLLDNEYVLRRTTPEAMSWGIRPVWIGDRRVQFADPTRTVIDILASPQLAGGISLAAEILEEYLSRQTAEMLIDYGDRLGNGVVFKRLGYLLEARHGTDTSLVELCHSRISKGFSTLNPGSPPGSTRDPKWRLWINAATANSGPS